ncbi:MAG: NnrS family protein [Rhodanobacteraceae bacterium]|nr:NnrS family protein [Rhodanobacteraceae bacterium]MBK7044469.1 NnrS family protein [Rhodanobacteraceae bacterium]HQW80627.1 NnrS family protein [Pseudomonadota bacterium]
MTNLLPISPRLLAAAPHRLLFFIGATNVMAAMAWWALWLLHARFGVIDLGQPPIVAGWAHAFVMQYQVLPPFMFGFLLTVFPRWMGQPDLTPWHYLPVGLGLLSGQLLFLIGLFGFPHLVHLGVVNTIAGWLAGCIFLFGPLRGDGFKTWHAISAFSALSFGLLGLILFAVYLHGGHPAYAIAMIKIGTFGLLLPIYVTVAHRMFPFFAGIVVRGYVGWKSLGWLLAFWIGVLAHLALELAHANAWLWLVDLPMTGLTGYWLWRNWPRGAAPPLLRVLFTGFAWLPVAMLLYAVQSMIQLVNGELLLGRAPAHALFVGFFGSLLVAMVTRVTQGHSGRPLQLGTAAAIAFTLIQCVAILRIVAELLPDAMLWQAIAACAWLVAFLPWVLRSLFIYTTPRVDAKPG